jgi:hypothetical protein
MGKAGLFLNDDRMLIDTRPVAEHYCSGYNNKKLDCNF